MLVFFQERESQICGGSVTHESGILFTKDRFVEIPLLVMGKPTNTTS
jgi:hypothetical protein